MERKGIVHLNAAVTMFQLPDQVPPSSLAIEKFENSNPGDTYFRALKRAKVWDREKVIASMCAGTEGRERSQSNIKDYTDPSVFPSLLEGLNSCAYGSVTKDVEDLQAQWMQIVNSRFPGYQSVSGPFHGPWSPLHTAGVNGDDELLMGQDDVNRLLTNQHSTSVSQGIIDLEVDVSSHDLPGFYVNKKRMDTTAIVVIDDDEEDGEDRISIRPGPKTNLELLNSEVLRGSHRQRFHDLEKQRNWGHSEPGFSIMDYNISVAANMQHSYAYQKVVLKSAIDERPIQEVKVRPHNKSKVEKGEKITNGSQTPQEKALKALMISDAEGSEGKTELVSYAVLEEDSLMMKRKDDKENDGLANIWMEMTLALECSKDATSDSSFAVHEEEAEECEHSCFLKDDLGYVCRICGVIQKSIETIFDYQWIKGSKTTRTYASNSRNAKDADGAALNNFSGYKDFEHDDALAEIAIHPRHMKQMKAHQLEGFNFLLRNLVADKPGGCILAHAPGSGKTFMIISFIQSYLAKYPHARPLIVLPKGILPTWKKEFQRWQVEDIPLLDFYSSKADNRLQQLDVLNNWVENRSILFLGYKQFSNIICGNKTSKTEAACQERLLKVPSLLILDEGHTPRNDNTDMLHSLEKVQTPRKVVLSGTLFQNHVKEVFNILNLVRPKFLKLESSRAVVKRVLSRVNMSGGSRRQFRSGVDTTFYDLVEETLQNDDDFKRKISVIQDLREMTKNVLHYYKGDFLDELPGLIDVTVLLNLAAKQKNVVEKLRKLEKFKRSAVGSAIYIHPHLRDVAENTAGGEKGIVLNDDKIDQLVEKMNVRDGVKTNFFLHILGLSVSSGEKLLVFSQYLLPLKFLERLVVRLKGWSLGKEIFMISGDSSTENREWSMEQFNNSPDAKVLFGSIKACGEGISLVGASRVVVLDVHLNPSVTRQAIGRAFRPGQLKKVHTYRLVAADSPEEEDHYTSFRKELTSKMWFEWNEFCGNQDFEMEAIDVTNCEDSFFDSPFLREDVKALYKR